MNSSVGLEILDAREPQHDSPRAIFLQQLKTDRLTRLTEFKWDLLNAQGEHPQMSRS